MKKYSLLILTALMLFLSSCEPLTPIPASLSAIIMEIEGDYVSVRHANTEQFVAATMNETIQVKSQVETGQDSRSRIDLSSGTILRLAPESLFTLESNYQEKNDLLTRLKIEAGSVWIILNGGSLDIETPSGLAGVRGSYMSTGYDPASGAARITCLEGHCSAENESGSVEFTAGEAADLPANGNAPVKGLMTAEEFSLWAENVPEAANLVPTQMPPTPTAMPTITPQLESCTVNSTFLYIRTCPASTCATLGYVELDDQLTLASQTGTDSWISVIFEGKTGWINSQFCQKKE